jgi:hypothetical protein
VGGWEGRSQPIKPVVSGQRSGNWEKGAEKQEEGNGKREIRDHFAGEEDALFRTIPTGNGEFSDG